MAEYSLSDSKGFIVKRSEVDGRLDPYYNFYLKNIQLKSIFKEESLYKISKPFSGGTPSKNNTEYWEGDIPWVSPKDFKGLYLDESEDHISEKGLQNSSTKLVPAYSVLIVVRSGILIHSLPVTINTVPVTINQDLKAFVINDDRILPEYLGIYFYVFGRKLLPLIMKHSTTVQSINTEQFAKLKIPIPDKTIQERIIALLNTALNNKQQKEKEARDLLNGIDDYLLQELGITLPQKQNDLQSRIFTTSFSEVTGSRFDPLSLSKSIVFLFESEFEYVPLMKYASGFVSGFGAGRSEQVQEENGVVQIRPTNIDSQGNLKFDKNIFVPKEFIRSNYFLEYKDVLFNNTNSQDLVGKTSIYENQLPEVTFSNHITKFTVNEATVNPYYVKEILNLYQRHSYFYSVCTNWNNQSGVGIELLKQVKIPLPDLTVQNRIATYIQDLRNGAKSIEKEAANSFESIKAEIEKLILG